MPVVYIPGPAPQVVSPLDFGHTDGFIESSYDAARSFLEATDVTGPGLYGSPSI